MKMKIEEMPRASEGDTIELEGKVFRLKEPNSNDFDGEIVWGQFVVLKDESGEQGCWLKLGSQEDKVTKGMQISINGKLGKEYTTSRGKKARSINNCDFEVIGKMQAPALSSTPQSSNGTKDNYWEKKFKYEVGRDPIVQLVIIRQCAIKAVTELAKVTPSKNFTIKVHTEKDFFEFAIKIEKHIFRNLILKESVLTFGGKITSKNGTSKVETKEEKIEKAEEIVGGTRFKPASTKQKNIIFGYKDKDKWHKGIIESRYIETPEIKEIGDPKKLSVEEAGEWITFWWGEEGNPEDIGARKQRELDNPRDDKGNPLNALVKGDETSLTKDILIDEVNALRRENRLNDDEKFQKEMGYNPATEELTEEELKKLKELLKHYHPSSWDEK